MSLLLVRKSAPAKAANDAADADKSKELEREIKGDVVAVVSGNAARVSKDVPFATAKEGVESFARKNGVSVVASQEYGEAYKFKFSAAIDCAADAAPEFKVGDKIWVAPSYGANLNIGYGWNVGVVKRVGTGYIDVDFKGQVISVPAPYCARVNSSGKPVFDSAAGAAQDSGNYTTNTIALLKMAFDNLNKAESVVRAVLRNISNAFDKVQDAQTKSSLNYMEKDWSACEREIWETLQKVKSIAVPSNYGIPHKAKLSPEDRKFIEAFFE